MADLTTGDIRKLISEGRADKVSKEDLEMFYENESQRELLSVDGIKRLYKAVCLRSVDDYKNAKKNTAVIERIKLYGGHLSESNEKKEAQAQKELAECELFFDSEFFKNVSGTRGKNHVMEAIAKEEKRKAQLAMIKA